MGMLSAQFVEKKELVKILELQDVFWRNILKHTLKGSPIHASCVGKHSGREILIRLISVLGNAFNRKLFYFRSKNSLASHKTQYHKK